MFARVGAMEMDDERDVRASARLQDPDACGAIFGQHDVGLDPPKSRLVGALVVTARAAALQEPSESRCATPRDFFGQHTLAIERGRSEIAAHDADDAGQPFSVCA